jgi:hypothetical protein
MNRIIVFAFADEMATDIHQSNLFADCFQSSNLLLFIVDHFVFGEIVEAQMLRQLCQLIVAQLLAEELTDLDDFPSEILIGDKDFHVNGQRKMIFLFFNLPV